MRLSRFLCMNPRFLILIFGTFALLVARANDSAGHAFFENKIRPVLVEHCYECHSAESEKVGGKLLLDTRDGWQAGGEAGSPIIAGNPSESLLLQALRWQDDFEMPPEEPLPETVIADFTKWIEMGAPDPRSGEFSRPQSKDSTKLWSLQSVENPEVPAITDENWIRDSLDAFVLARLESLGEKPADGTPQKALIRRLYIDLLGLPPTLDQLHSALRIPTSALVDELLASSHFGERWGRHWLDVARYAESNGNDGLSRNPTFPHAWRYRDYVISAFNADTPYDRFLTEQIAGDLLPFETPEERDKNLIATGFLALGAKPAKAMNNNFAMDVVADQIEVVGTGIMGLSVACARCHDHKFDPIPTRDYYALAGMFTSSETMWGLAGNEKLTAPPTDLHVLQVAAKVLPPADFVETVILRVSNTGLPKEIPKPKWEMGTPLAMGIRDRKKVADCKINLKGDAKKLGEAVPRGFLTAISAPSPEVDPKQSGRLQLAEWLTSGEHPLTARVMVNRIWLHLFGEGIVTTPDDFGVYGERPTNPELLDHLATRFVEGDWSVKRLIREIVLSRTYQQARSARRMDAETLRDAILLASGQLDCEPAEGSLIRHRDILINLAQNSLHQPSNHRSIYLCYLRNSPPPELAAFDLPDFASVKGQRDESTVPGHALYLFNNPFVIEQARHLAELVSGDLSEAYERVLNRQPSADETYRANELIAASDFASFCQALLATNEFRYVD